MKLARIEIENFRKLGAHGRPFELDFVDSLGRVRDLTLLVGPNTCGKTTILDAIAAAIGPTLELPATRSEFKLSPWQVVSPGALRARVTCWIQFSEDELIATREILSQQESPETVSDVRELELTWEYPDPRGKSRFGYTQCTPRDGWHLLKSRVRVARLLAVRRLDFSWFRLAGGVFTFDQERTGLGRTVSRRLANLIAGGIADADQEIDSKTTDPREILIDMWFKSVVPKTTGETSEFSDFDIVKACYEKLCAPHRITGVKQEKGEIDVFFHDGVSEYSFAGLSSGQRMALLVLIRFVTERIHRSIVLIDELELNQHPIWQRKLLHLIPKMGEENQIIATTHSPYLRDAVRPDAVIDLGQIEDSPIA